MTHMEINRLILTVIGAASTAFPVIYTTIAPWWKSALGRALVFSDASLALYVDLALLMWWFDLRFNTWIYTFLFSLIAVTAVSRCIVIVTTQVGGRRYTRNTPPERDVLDAPGSQM